jgi:Zn-dependent protease
MRAGDGIEMANLMAKLAGMVFVLLFCLSVHECAHAWAAKKLGDSTAYNHGRLTLNPGKHLDPIGSLMILLVGFGYAKPVPVNPRNFKHYKKGMALTAAAGPLSNLLMGILFGIAACAAYLLNLRFPSDLAGLLVRFFGAIFTSNIGLMVFNLIPIPPLDGARLLDLVLPARVSDFLARYERYMMYGVMLLLFFRVLDLPLSWLVLSISKLIVWPFAALFGVAAWPMLYALL